MKIQKVSKTLELKPAELRWKCNPAIFDFESTNELEPIEGIVGQERALRALQLGVDIKAPGYNIFIAGLSGTGKTTTVKSLLESISSAKPNLYDYAYVNNFEDPDTPILLIFPAGKAKDFKKDISSLVSFLRERVPALFDTENYRKKKKMIVEKFSKQEKTLLSSFESKLKQDGFSLGQVQVGETTRPEVIPVIENQPVPIFQLGGLIEEGKLNEQQVESLMEKYNDYQQEMVTIFKKGMKIDQERQEKLSKLEQEEVKLMLSGAMSSLKESYEDEKVLNYLHQLESRILENLQVFKGIKPGDETTPEGFVIDYFKEYEVNIILDNSNTKECPVVVEITPSFTNLFGTIEKINDGKGGWYADFTRIKAGSLLRANGGFIVLRAIHLFEEPGVWRTLKRILNYRKLDIQDTPTLFPFTPSILKPEPIEIDAKVILIGSNYIYSLLSGYEDDFKKIFKIKADFDDEVKRSGEIMLEYARVIKKLVKEESLLAFDKTAIAYLLELASRYAGEKEKLTTRFSFLADIAREANFWAIKRGTQIVTADDIRSAYEQARERHGLLEEKISERIQDNTFLIETDGERVGCINGLAVYGSDFFSFGRPTRITASISIGNGAIVNVEREAGLSGKSYDKGILIISGYFKETFGQHFPLSFSANLVFEQSYGMVDGDSASAAEVFSLISALSHLPLEQSIAVTGSVNQKGDIQPIGGVNEKIEGFYDVCKSRKLTKRQGVIIPAQNVKDLMLRDDIIESVKKKEFHVYPISRVEEGVEILTGHTSGMPGHKYTYAKNTVYGLVQERLKYMYEKAKNPFKAKETKKGRTTKKPVVRRRIKK